MWKGLEAFAGSKTGLFILWVLSLTLVYHFAQSIEEDKNNAVESAVSSVAAQASKQLETTINTQVGSINARLTGDKHATDFLLNGQLAAVQNAADSLNNLAHAGVLVKASPGAATKGTTVGAAGSGPGNHETYRAELSDETRAFFTSEANRADLCAVRLTGAQSTILSWRNAVDDYNRTVAVPAKIKPVVLPSGK